MLNLVYVVLLTVRGNNLTQPAVSLCLAAQMPSVKSRTLSLVIVPGVFARVTENYSGPIRVTPPLKVGWKMFFRDYIVGRMLRQQM